MLDQALFLALLVEGSIAQYRALQSFVMRSHRVCITVLTLISLIQIKPFSAQLYL